MFIAIVTLAVVLSLLFSLLRFYWSVLTTRDLPPGPFPLPFLGNAHVLSGDVHVSLVDLAQKYGDMMTIYFGTERAVIVSSPELARQVLVKQSDDFGGRPANLPYSLILISHDKKDLALHYDMTNQWKTQKKAFHSALKSFGKGLRPLEDHVTEVVQDLVGQLRTYLGTTINIIPDIHLCIANIITKITFGWKYDLKDEECKQLMEAFATMQDAAVPGGMLDLVPLLRKLPIKYVRKLHDAVQFFHGIIAREHREHKKQLNADAPPRDFMEAVMKQRRDACAIDANFEGYILTEDDIEFLMSDVFGGGIDTSVATITWGLYELAKHSQLQDAIREEMREQLESETLPTFDDRRRLPLLWATVTEILRHSSVIPLLLPHRAVKDTLLGDHVIPKNTTVMVNAWAIHRDPRIWGDPDTFRPSRFLDENGRYSPPADTAMVPFGAGARGCPGKVLGKMMVFLTISRMLYTYRFTLVSDQNMGRNSSPQLILHPRDYEVLIEKNN